MIYDKAIVSLSWTDFVIINKTTR